MKLKRLSGIVLALVMAVSVMAPTNLVPVVQVKATTKKATKKIKLNHKKTTIYVGQKIKLKLKNAKAKKVHWKSSNKKIATVKKGVVKGKKKGKAFITAKYKGKKYKAIIKVKKKKKNKTIPVYRKSVKATTVMQGQKMIDGMDQGDNIIVSPVSLNIVLGMLANGANVKEQEDLEKYLGNTKSEYNQNVKNFMKRLSGDKMLYTYNSVWYKNLYQLNVDFEKAMKDNYFADIHKIEMVKEDVETINQWAADKTDKMIPEIISDLKPDTLAILINALLFKGKWTKSFNNELTNKKDFTLAGGKKKQVLMMHSTEGVYYENRFATGFEKTYGENGEYSFVAILPKKNGKFSMAGLDLEGFLKSGSKEYAVDIEMPKFTYDWNDDGKLNGYLKANGLASIFDAYSNPMGKIFNNNQLAACVSEVLQKCKIIVDEEGTKAAAVTAAVVSKSSMPVHVKERKEVLLNRPFGYMIIDNQTGEVLFMGKCMEP